MPGFIYFLGIKFLFVKHYVSMKTRPGRIEIICMPCAIYFVSSLFIFQMDETGILINCFSLEGQLAKLEIMGSKAFGLLQKILHPITW